MCNYVDPISEVFVSELCITSPGKDILPDLVVRGGNREGQSSLNTDKRHEHYGPRCLETYSYVCTYMYI